MLALPEERRTEIEAQQTVSQIREIAKEEESIKEPSEKEIMHFYGTHIKTEDEEPRETLKDRLKEKYRNAGGTDGVIAFTASSRGIKINKADEITWSYLVKLVNQYISKKTDNIICWKRERPDTEKKRLMMRSSQIFRQIWKRPRMNRGIKKLFTFKVCRTINKCGSLKFMFLFFVTIWIIHNKISFLLRYDREECVVNG